MITSRPAPAHPGRRRVIKITLAILGFLALTAALVSLAIVLHIRAARAGIWRDLSALVPAAPITPSEAETTDGSLMAKFTADHKSELGSIHLANGDIWRFAFRSHHLIGGPDSYSVFAGPSGTFRVRGDYFCCEVQVPPEATSKDSSEFLAFLRRVHPSVTPITGQTKEF